MERRSDGCWFLLTASTLDTAAVDRALRDDRAGGIAVFVGTTRRWTGGRETQRLRYEAYDEMAIDEMARLAERARARWDLFHVVIHHRLGDVAPSEASVVVGVATAHRAEAFEACRFLIDALKETVPVWKKEWFADGSTEWVQGSQPGGA